MRAAAVQSGAGAFRAVFLTHLHSDHITDLNDIFTMRWATSFQPNPLRVIGPIGTAALLEATEAMLEPDIGYRIAHHDDLTWRPTTLVAEVEQGVVFEENGVTVTAGPTDHSPVRPTVGYRIEEGGESVVISGDTVPCKGLDDLCNHADMLVQTTIRRDFIEQLGIPRLLDILAYHSSVTDAAGTASRNHVRTLVITHMVPAPAPGTENEWMEQAAVVFDGEVIMATDLLTLDVRG
jgi:ribonuclease Z